jgi:ketosteroid isomerase-like protein
MRLRLISVALFLVGAAACAHSPRALSEAHVTAMRDSVQQTLARFRQYSAARQWDSLVTLYANDPRFHWVENGVVRYRSPAMIRAGFTSLPSDMRIETTYRDTEIVPIAPGVASVTTLFHTRFVGATSAFEFGGAMTMTLVHQPDGWRILSGHTSSPIPRTR